MSNRHLLPNLTNQHQQRQMQLYIQSTEASLKQLPGSDPLIAAEIQLQELAECANQLNQSLVLVGHVSPMFDINYLTKEGVTNISGLDQQYMSVIGRQLINDYHVYRGTAQLLSTRINNLFEKFNVLKQNNSEDMIAEILTDATFIHEEYVQWVESFLRVIGAATRDVINHLNIFRLPTHQIQHPFPETTEVVIA